MGGGYPFRFMDWRLLALVFAPIGANAAIFESVAGGVLMVETTTQLTYTSNILLNSDEVEDLFISFEPMLVFQRATGILHLQAEVGNRLTAYRDADALNAQDWRTALRLSGPHRNRSRLSAGAELSWQEFSDPTQEVGAPVERDALRISGFGQWRATHNVELRLSSQSIDERFRTFDRDARTMDFRLEGIWVYSENLRVFGGYRQRTIENDGLLNAVSLETHTLLIGLRGEVTEKLSGSLELGLSLPEESFRENFLFYAIDLQWEATDKRRWFVRGRRDTEASLRGDDLINTRLDLGVVQQFRQKISGTAYIGARRLERFGIENREDDIYSIGTGLRFAMDSRRSLAADLRYEDSNSTDPFYTYCRVTATLTFNFRF